MECRHLLPPESCGLCTGSARRFDQELREAVSDLISSEDPLDREIAFDALRDNEVANDFSALPPERDARIHALDDMSIQEEHRRTHSTGMWNKAREVHGGNDDQIDFEDLAPEN